MERKYIKCMWVVLVFFAVGCKKSVLQDRRELEVSTEDKAAAFPNKFRSPEWMMKEEIKLLRADLREFRLAADLSDKSPDDEFMDGLIQNVLKKSDDEIIDHIMSPEYESIRQETGSLFLEGNEKEDDVPDRKAQQDTSGNGPVSDKGQNKEKQHVDNPLTAYFGGKYNDYNGSLMLLSLGLMGIVNGLGEAGFGHRIHGAVTTGIGLAMLVCAKKMSEGKASNDLKAVSGGLVMSNSLISLTGAAIFFYTGTQMMTGMTNTQKVNFANWMSRLGVIKPKGTTDFSDVKYWGKPEELPSKLKNHLDPDALAKIDFTVQAAGGALGVYAVIGAGLAVKRLFDSYSTLKGIKKENSGLHLTAVRKYDEAGQKILRQLNYRAKRLEILKKNIRSD